MDFQNPNNNNLKRWYEKNNKISIAAQLILKFPPDLQEEIFKGVDILVQREFKNSEIKNQYKTLGHDKVMAIYKSKQKKRDYDQNPVIHKGMNQLMLLSEEDQVFVADHILSLLGMIKTYLTHNTDPYHAEHQIGSITHTYVNDGPEAAERLVSDFVSTFMADIENQSGLGSSRKQAGQKVQGTGTDMKISSDH